MQTLLLLSPAPPGLDSRVLLDLWIFDTLVPTAAAVFQKCSVSSMYFLSITVLLSYRRLYGYLKQSLVELSPQKGTRAERNPAVP